MQVPNPLGGYPLTLREDKTTEGRPGELLFDYIDNKIYYIDIHDNTHVELAKRIYDKIIAARLENNKIFIRKESNLILSEEPMIPEPVNRPFNSWYMNIYQRIPMDPDEIPEPVTYEINLLNEDFIFIVDEIIVDIQTVPPSFEINVGDPIGRELEAPTYILKDYNGNEITDSNIVFLGWFGGDSEDMVTPQTIPTGNLNLRAIFERIRPTECTIRFELNPYQDLSEFDVEISEPLEEYSIIVESGTAINGDYLPIIPWNYTISPPYPSVVVAQWVTDPQDPLTVIEDYDSMTITEDLTLYTYFSEYFLQ